MGRRRLRVMGASLVILGALILYLLRGELLAMALLVVEFLGILVAVLLIVAGVAMVVGRGWIGRGAWIGI